MINLPNDENILKKIKFINEVKIFNELQNNHKLIIFDLRSSEDFFDNRLEFSINIPTDKFDKSFFSTLNNEKLEFISKELVSDPFMKDMLKRYKRYYIVVIMGQNKIKRKHFKQGHKLDDEKDKIEKSLTFYKALMDNKVREMGFFNLGFDTIEKRYPFLILKNNLPALSKNICGFPSSVFDHKIYVGNQSDALSEEVIQHLKITHIVNVTQHVENRFQGRGVKYINVKIDDNESFKVADYFKQVYDFIEDALVVEFSQVSTDSGDDKEVSSSGDELTIKETLEKINCKMSLWKDSFMNANSDIEKNKILQVVFKESYLNRMSSNRILIHCSLGVSRSATFTILYMMKKFKLSFDASLEFLRFHREKSCPISPFQEELEDFAQNGFLFK